MVIDSSTMVYRTSVPPYRDVPCDATMPNRINEARPQKNILRSKMIGA